MLQAAFKANFEVITATSGTEALEILKMLESQNDLPAVALVDVTLAGQCGIQTARTIRRQFPGIKTALMSGYTRDGLLVDDSLSDVPFFPKPFDLLALMNFVSDVAQDTGPPVPQP